MAAACFFISKGRYDMQKEPMKKAKETVLPEIKRRKRKVPESEHRSADISYLKMI
jgi:hypothetical protein